MQHYTEVRFASFLSSGFTTMAVINPPERNLTKRTSVHYVELTENMYYFKVLMHCFVSVSLQGYGAVVAASDFFHEVDRPHGGPTIDSSSGYSAGTYLLM